MRMRKGTNSRTEKSHVTANMQQQKLHNWEFRFVPVNCSLTKSIAYDSVSKRETFSAKTSHLHCFEKGNLYWGWASLFQASQHLLSSRCMPAIANICSILVIAAFLTLLLHATTTDTTVHFQPIQCEEYSSVNKSNKYGNFRFVDFCSVPDQ